MLLRLERKKQKGKKELNSNWEDKQKRANDAKKGQDVKEHKQTNNETTGVYAVFISSWCCSDLILVGMNE